MSGIAGIFNRDGRPVERELLGRMTDAIAHRGPDGTHQWIDGAVGFGHQMLCTTPESLHETQPLRDASGQLCLVMDGRVDNCAELRSALLARGARLRDDTDAELVLQSYVCWGEECPKHIIGDFAFAIWDARRQLLFCARDFLGVRPFYYYLDGRTFRFGSELHQILEDESISREPNEGMIGEYLANRIVSREETLYRSIMRLTPAHTMIIRRDSVRKHCHWQLDDIKTVRYKSDAEYTEHFLSIFEEAVRCRMRSHRPVGAYLSGGLDSSSVVGVAQSFINAGKATVADFATFSMIFPDWPECDEREFIDQANKMWGTKSYAVCPSKISSSIYCEQANFFCDLPDYSTLTSLEGILELAHSSGYRVLLTGYGGDEWLTGSDYYYADLLWKLKFPRLFLELEYSIKNIGIKQTLEQFFLYGLRPIFPPKLRNFVRNIVEKREYLSWIDDDFIIRNLLSERIASKQITRLSDSYTRKSFEFIVESGHLAHIREFQNRLSARFGIEERHPFLDYRLVEFIMALPTEYILRNGQTKYILRTAIKNYIPEAVRLRTDKAEFSHLIPTTLRTVGGDSFFENLEIANINWVDQSEAHKMYNSMELNFENNSYEYIEYVWIVWRIFAVEQWYRENVQIRKNNFAPV